MTKLIINLFSMGGTPMKKVLIILGILGVLILAGCATNEASIAETTSDSFASTPVIIQEMQEESQMAPVISSVEEADALSQAEPSLEEEGSSESFTSKSSEVINEVEVESEEEVLENEGLEEEYVPIPDSIYTNYELEDQLIEDKRLELAMNAVVSYLKENNHYFDSAEYHFKIIQLPNPDLIELTITEQYSDGEIIRGIFDYNLEERSIDKIHK